MKINDLQQGSLVQFHKSYPPRILPGSAPPARTPAAPRKPARSLTCRHLTLPTTTLHPAVPWQPPRRAPRAASPSQGPCLGGGPERNARHAGGAAAG
jgi:hypothetical protein